MGLELIKRVLLRWRESLEAAETTRLRRWLGAVTLIFIATLLTHKKLTGQGDEPHYMAIAQSLAFDHDLDLANNYGDRANIILGGFLEHGRHARQGRGGVLRPVHDIGMPFLWTPYYALAQTLSRAAARALSSGLVKKTKTNSWGLLKWFMSMSVALAAAFLAIALFDLCLFFSGHKALSFTWALLTILSPPVLTLSFIFMTEVPSALMATLAYREIKLRPERGPLRTLLLGTAVGGLFLIHARNAGLAAGLTLTTAYAMRRSGRSLVAFAAGLALAVAARTLLNWHLWGAWVTTPHAALNMAWTMSALLKEAGARLGGLIFDQQNGLLLNGPAYLLVLPGIALLLRSSRAVFIEISLPVLGYLALVLAPFANIHGWGGGPGFTQLGRFLVPIAPFLSLAAFKAVCSGPRARRWLWIFGGLQAVITLTIWQRPSLATNFSGETSALWTFLGGRTPAITTFLPSWTFPFTTDLALSGILLAAWIAITWDIVRSPA
ncbi:MAG: hypothetical protein HY547_04565 [Elusimicrobia bacterium]|nr:hypothetical protein [Elusimicrobiota bacterium]